MLYARTDNIGINPQNENALFIYTFVCNDGDIHMKYTFILTILIKNSIL
jgi:hypothetical protein